MNRRLPTLITCLALASLTAAACGGGKGSGDGDDDDDDDGADSIAPSIVSFTPASGATGVRADADVVIVFSEPMEQASVEGTLLATDLGTFTLSWNAAGDTLTITPDSPLAYAEGLGDNPGLVEAQSYHVVIGTGATDLAGNAITAGGETLFHTLKAMSSVYEAVASMTNTGTAADGPIYADTDPIAVGDDTSDIEMRGFVTFDISMMPTTAVEVVDATFATRQTGGFGTPYVDLGSDLYLEHIVFSAIDNAAFNATSSLTILDFAGESDVVLESDVTTSVDEDLAERLARNDRSQFRMRFQEATDLDGTSDATVISRDLLELQVTYLAP